MSGRTTCPSCQGPLSTAHVCPRGLVCPHCQHPLDEVILGDLDPDASVRRRPKAAFWLFVLLCLLLVVGLIGSVLFVLLGS